AGAVGGNAQLIGNGGNGGGGGNGGTGADGT
ncbi:PE-PGRS family protein, partial [Mycobacterium tuberculosis]